MYARKSRTQNKRKRYLYIYMYQYIYTYTNIKDRGVTKILFTMFMSRHPLPQCTDNYTIKNKIPFVR